MVLGNVRLRKAIEQQLPGTIEPPNTGLKVGPEFWRDPDRIHLGLTSTGHRGPGLSETEQHRPVSTYTTSFRFREDRLLRKGFLFPNEASCLSHFLHLKCQNLKTAGMDGTASRDPTCGIGPFPGPTVGGHLSLSNHWLVHRSTSSVGGVVG